jgi:hypothetical protein
MSHQSQRRTPIQLHRKRTAEEAEWTNIMEECGNKSLVEVSKCHPKYSYNQIRKRYKRFKEGDVNAVSDMRGNHSRIFSDEQERELAKRIRMNRDIFNIHYDINTIRVECINYFRELHANTRQNVRMFSDGFIKGFKCRHGFEFDM